MRSCLLTSITSDSQTSVRAWRHRESVDPSEGLGVSLLESASTSSTTGPLHHAVNGAIAHRVKNGDRSLAPIGASVIVLHSKYDEMGPDGSLHGRATISS